MEWMVMSDPALVNDYQIQKESRAIAAMSTFFLLGIMPGFFLMEPSLPCEGTKLLPLQFPVSLPLPGYAQSKIRLGKGRFLVAARELKDPNFSESVVLLIDYNRNGALGLVINRTTEVRLSMMFPEMEGFRQSTDNLFIGGPVAADHLMLLIRSGDQPEDSFRVFEDIYITSSQAVFQKMAEEKRWKFRVYAGHAGWAPGQLDQEVSRGDWHILPADAETIFEKVPSGIWPELIRMTSGLWVKALAPSSADASLFLEEKPVCVPEKNGL
jgi:putative transcriptional regulator